MALAPPFPTGLLYLGGTLLILLSAVLFRSRIHRQRSGGWGAVGNKQLAAVIGGVLVGSFLIGSGLSVDANRWTSENTKSLYYYASIRINGTGPVILFLPAPLDSRFWSALNATNGTSSLRLVHTSNDTQVVITASRDVTFNVVTHFVSPSFDIGLTHVGYAQGGPYGPANATIEMRAGGSGAIVLLDLDISLGDYCHGYWHEVTASVHEGIATYPMDAVLSVC